MNADKVFSLQDGEQYLTFSVRKMPPAQLERWLLRANALLLQGAAMPEDGYLAACRTLAKGGPLALLRNGYSAEAQALGDELLACCSRRLDNMDVHCTPDAVDGFIQEVTTLFTLKNEALKLNLDFMPDGDAPRQGA